MATDKYALPDYVTARVRYYNGQFLRDDDFIDEQRYQIVEQRRHERLLHIAGVTEGLDVSSAAGGSSVKIAAGSAIDDKGRAVRLDQDVTLPVTGSGQVYVELAFSEAETNPSDQNSSVQSNTRFTQNARPTLSTSRTAGTVLLAELSLTSSAITKVLLDNRAYSGVRLPGPVGAGGYLRSRGDATAGWAELGCSLSVKGDALVNGGLSFGSQGRQMLNLYSTTYGAGIQSNTLYLRTDKNFAVYKGGTHDNTELSAGTGGSVQLAIKDGNVGIATSGPAGKLHVLGTGSSGASIIGGLGTSTASFNATGWTLTNALEARSGQTEAVPGVVFHQQNVMTLGIVAQSSPRGLRITGPTNESAPGLFVDGDGGIGGTLSFGSKNRQMLNLYGTVHAAGVQNSTTYFRSSKNFAFYKGGAHSDTELDAGTDGTAQLVITDSKVGIGTTTPRSDLTIRRDAKGALGPVLTLQNNGGFPGAGAAIDMNGYDPSTNDPSLRIQSLDDGTYSSHLVFLTKDPGNIGNKLKERMRIANDGTVSISLGRVVACKEETIRIIRGLVDSSGKATSGSGFTVRRLEKGIYDITFSTGFATRPSVVATQHYPSDDDKGGNTRDNATVVLANTDKARIKTGNSDGDASDRHFCFMAIGT